ncbi:unnamed protein product [Owenia fusiformis]|uniref:Leucine-rich repeat-containing protein 23 n=1 Tax=Owenia fusiformis TaxID=6347 RepID=A0A8S4Q9N0_OWEFU|nr:unnamed protein product [Owenia fusiformis]
MSDHEDDDYDPAAEEGEDDELGEEEDKSGEEEENVEEEEEEKLPEVPLTEEMMAECLSLLCKTGDGLAHAYVRVDLHERDLTDISLLNSYIHLRYVDISKNNLKDISPLNSLTHLLTLKADGLLINCAKLEELPYLQVASFNNCRITTTEGVSHPLIEHLSLNFNQITMVKQLDSVKLSRLHTLEMRSNKLETTDGIYLPNLKNLFVGANVIKKLEGLERLEHLTTLHLRDNQIESLDGFSEMNRNLQYINLRGNNISDIKECEKLKVLPKLRALVLSENPVAEDEEYRLEVLIAIRKLERLDKDEYNEDERQEAEETFEQRRQEAIEKEQEAEVIEDE